MLSTWLYKSLWISNKTIISHPPPSGYCGQFRLLTTPHASSFGEWTSVFDKLWKTEKVSNLRVCDIWDIISDDWFSEAGHFLENKPFYSLCIIFHKNVMFLFINGSYHCGFIFNSYICVVCEKAFFKQMKTRMKAFLAS